MATTDFTNIHALQKFIISHIRAYNFAQYPDGEFDVITYYVPNPSDPRHPRIYASAIVYLNDPEEGREWKPLMISQAFDSTMGALGELYGRLAEELAIQEDIEGMRGIEA